jgi:hypothetical protein
MPYQTTSSILSEITRLMPDSKAGEGGKYPEAGKRWPFLNNGNFDFEDGLGRLRLIEPGSYETLEALASLS